jgi:uncharacterized protein (DUF2147 family)
MVIKSLISCFLFYCGMQTTTQKKSVPPEQRICGKWESAEKQLVIQVYVENHQFKAKILWFRDTDGKPMSYWKDVHNPNPKLRGRKILGMSILTGLKYDSETNSWEGGTVYESHHGRYWNASGRINKKGQLKVRGYWHFKFIGRTMTFYRVY